MSATAFIAFTGIARCSRGRGAGQLRISGTRRSDGVPVVVYVNGTPGVQLPEQLPEAEIHAPTSAADPCWHVQGGGNLHALPARSLQVHRAAAPAFWSSLPAVTAPWRKRAGWVVLLNLLRVPGMIGLLRMIKG